MNRADEYRDLLEAWAQWWNHLGREHYHHPVIPPITATSKALHCYACKGVGEIEAAELPSGRCEVCCGKVP